MVEAAEPHYHTREMTPKKNDLPPPTAAGTLPADVLTQRLWMQENAPGTTLLDSVAGIRRVFPQFQKSAHDDKQTGTGEDDEDSEDVAPVGPARGAGQTQAGRPSTSQPARAGGQEAGPSGGPNRRRTA